MADKDKTSAGEQTAADDASTGHDEPVDAKEHVRGHNYEVGSAAALTAVAGQNPVMADTDRTWSGQTATQAAQEQKRARTHKPRYGDDYVGKSRTDE